MYGLRKMIKFPLITYNYDKCKHVKPNQQFGHLHIQMVSIRFVRRSVDFSQQNVGAKVESQNKWLEKGLPLPSLSLHL